VALIFVSIAFSQTPVYTARPCPRGYCIAWYVCLPSSQSWYSFYPPRRDGMLSDLSWLHTYPDGLPVWRWSPIQVPTWLTLINFIDDTNVVDHCSVLLTIVSRLVFMFVCVTDVDAGRALQRLTQPGPYALPSLEHVVSRATSNLVPQPEDTPISDDKLNAILLVCAGLVYLRCWIIM